MSKNTKTTILLWSNNSDLEEYLVTKDGLEISYQKFKENSKQADYLHLIIDLGCDLSSISSKVYSLYLSAKEKKIKTLFSLLFDSRTNSDILKKYQDLVETIDGAEKKHRLLLVKDLYTLDSIVGLTSLDKKILLDLNLKNVIITQKNQNLLSPVSTNDFLQFASKILFLQSTEGKTYHLEGEEISESNYSYILKSLSEELLDQEIDINTKKEDQVAILSNPSGSIETQAEINLVPKESFHENLKIFLKENKQLLLNGKRQTDSDSKTHKPSWLKKILNHFSNKEKESENLKQRAIKKIEKIFLAGTLYLLLGFFIISLIFTASSYYSLKNLEKSLFYLKKGDINQSSNYLNLSNYSFKISSTNFALISPILKVLSQDTATTGHNYLSFISFSKDTLEGLIQSYGLVEKIYHSINTPGEHDYQSLSLAIKSNLYQSYESLNQIEIILEKSNLPEPLLQVIKQNIEYKNLKNNQSQVSELIKLIDIIPSLLGDTSNSNVFLLIQNNHQIRPTGGLIEHVYHLSTEDGRPVFQKTYSSLEVDKVDEFVVDPPPLVKELTGADNWSLRDMNYNPDFPQTAVNISWYLEKKLKIKPDLVIALNLSFLENILKEKTSISEHLGRSYEDYRSDLLKGNATESTKELLQKFLDSVFNHKLPLVDLLKALGVNSGEYFVWATDSSLQNQLLSQRSSGSIHGSECHQGMSSSRKCISETIHLNFANFSSIPLNSYLSRTIDHNIVPELLGVRHQITVTSTFTSKPPLVNRNLVEVVQLYLPKEAVITSLKNNDQLIDINNLQAQDHLNLKRYQFVISNPLGEVYRLQISYTHQLPERTILPIAYSQTIIPQLGDNIERHTITVDLPELSRVSAVTTEVETLPNKISVDMSKIKTFGFNLVPK